MLLLIDSSGPELVCGLAADGTVLVEQRQAEGVGRNPAKLVEAVRREHSAALTGIVVGRGPGSFIGTRTAISFANGYAAVSCVPLYGVGSLDALAALQDARTAVLRDARRGQLFCRLPHADGAETLLQGSTEVAAALQQEGLSRAVLEYVAGERASERARAAIEPLLGAAGITLKLVRGVSAAGLLALQTSAEPADRIEPVYLRGFT